MRTARRAFALAALLPLLACGGAGDSDSADGEAGDGGGAAAAAAPAAAAVGGDGPRGLFFMTRFWVTTGSLEKVVWYFAPDGRVYQNLAEGFSDADLAAHTGPRGTYAVAGDELRVAWSDGTTEAHALERSGSGFTWNAGIFTPVRPFRDGASIAGRYEGGESFRVDAGNAAGASTTLELRPDGTYASGSVASARSTTGESELSAGTRSGERGTWRAAGYSLTLTDAFGKATRAIAFPYDDEKTEAYPDRLFFGGTMYTRQ